MKADSATVHSFSDLTCTLVENMMRTYERFGRQKFG